MFVIVNLCDSSVPAGTAPKSWAITAGGGLGWVNILLAQGACGWPGAEAVAISSKGRAHVERFMGRNLLAEPERVRGQGCDFVQERTYIAAACAGEGEIPAAGGDETTHGYRSVESREICGGCGVF